MQEEEYNQEQYTNHLSFREIIWGVKSMKLKIVSKPLCNEFEEQRERFIYHLVDQNILQSLSLSKVSYQYIFDEYIRIQKNTIAVDKMERQKTNLFTSDIIKAKQLQNILKSNISKKIQHSLDTAIRNFKYLLRFYAGLRQNRDGTYEAYDDNYKDLYFMFNEFIENHFNQFIQNLIIPLKEDSIVFNDAQKQDEYYFAITYPEDYIINKFTEYNQQQLSCHQRDQADLFQMYAIFLEDNNTNRINKDDIMSKINEIEAKDTKLIYQKKKDSKSENGLNTNQNHTQINNQNLKRTPNQVPNNIQIGKQRKSSQNTYNPFNY